MTSNMVQIQTKSSRIPRFPKFIKIIVCVEFILLFIASASEVYDLPDSFTNNYAFKPGYRSLRAVSQNGDSNTKFEFADGTNERDRLTTEVAVHIVLAYTSKFNIAGLENQKNASEMFGNASKLMTTFLMEGNTFLSIREARQISKYFQWNMQLKKQFGKKLWNYEFKSRRPEIEVIENWRELINRIFDWKHREMTSSPMGIRRTMKKKDNQSTKKPSRVKYTDDVDAARDKLLIERDARLSAINRSGENPVYKKIIDEFDTAIKSNETVVHLHNATVKEFLCFQSGHDYFANETLKIRREGYKLIRDLFLEAWELLQERKSTSNNFIWNDLKSFMFNSSVFRNTSSENFLWSVQRTGEFLDFHYVDGDDQIIASTDGKTIGKFVSEEEPSETQEKGKLRRILNEIMKLIDEVEKNRANQFVNEATLQHNSCKSGMELQVESRTNIELICAYPNSGKQPSDVTELLRKIGEIIGDLLSREICDHDMIMEKPKDLGGTLKWSFSSVEMESMGNKPRNNGSTYDNGENVGELIQRWTVLIDKVYKLNCTINKLDRNEMDRKPREEYGELPENYINKEKTFGDSKNRPSLTSSSTTTMIVNTTMEHWFSNKTTS